MVTGWGGLRGSDIPSNAFIADSLPFDWLFPHVCVSVHHGGAGTAAAALRAGIPSVTVPFALDQATWSRRLEQLGTGSAPLSAKRLSPERLAAAIRQTPEHHRHRDNAAHLGEKIRGEDGLMNAASIIEQAMTA